MSRTAKIAVVALIILLGLGVCGGGVVVVAAGLLAVQVQESAERARVESARLKLAQIDQALTLFELEHRSLPSVAEGLDGLPVDATDPWGRSILYLRPGPGDRAYDLISFGSDGIEGGTGTAADLRLSEL